jgi:hypothetical protein
VRSRIWAVICLIIGAGWLLQELRLTLFGPKDGTYGHAPFFILVFAALFVIYAVPGIVLLTVGVRLLGRETRE